MSFELQIDEPSPDQFYCTLVIQRRTPNDSPIVFHFAQMLMPTRDAAAALGAAALRSRQEGWGHPMLMTSHDPAEVDTIPAELLGSSILWA